MAVPKKIVYIARNKKVLNSNKDFHKSMMNLSRYKNYW